MNSFRRTSVDSPGPTKAETEEILSNHFDDRESHEHHHPKTYNDEHQHLHGSSPDDHLYHASQTAQAPHLHSRFTHQDLRLLSKSSTSSPLRVIALIDFDAFYAQCETVRLGIPPEKPLAVQQWHAIIALNYPARECGLKRGMSVDECRRICPEIILQHVATRREGDERWLYREDRDRMGSEKAALEPYRDESRKALAVIAECLSALSPEVVMEKASVDEMYLDLSAYVHGVLVERYPDLTALESLPEDHLPLPDTAPLDWKGDNVIVGEEGRALDWDDVVMHTGAEVVRELRLTVHRELGYTASAGIASNKVLAKLGAGCKKPNQQTLIRPSSVPSFLSSIPYKKIRGLGRQLGEAVEEAFQGTTSINDLLSIPLHEIQSTLGLEEGAWVYNVIRGVESSKVSPRSKPQSMLSQKTFTPLLPGIEQAYPWLRMFATELFDRVVALDTPGSRRRPRTLAVNHHINGRFGPTRRRQAGLPLAGTLTADMIYNVASSKLREMSLEAVSWPCAALGVVLSNFVELDSGSQSITAFFKPGRQVPDYTRSTQSLGMATLARSPRVLPTSSKFPRRGNVIDMFANQRRVERSWKEEGYLCSRCNGSIPEETVLEHLDWHMAKDLQAKG